MRTLTEKSQLLAKIIRQLKSLPPLTERKLEQSSFDRRDELVATFNALALPKYYIYVDDDWLCHVVMIKCSLGADKSYYASLSAATTYSADVIWNFDSDTGMWNTLKDRTGDFEKLCPMKFGSLPVQRKMT